MRIIAKLIAICTAQFDYSSLFGLRRQLRCEKTNSTCLLLFPFVCLGPECDPACASSQSCCSRAHRSIKCLCCAFLPCTFFLAYTTLPRRTIPLRKLQGKPRIADLEKHIPDTSGLIRIKERLSMCVTNPGVVVVFPAVAGPQHARVPVNASYTP